jgi:hypothetical protein
MDPSIVAAIVGAIAVLAASSVAYYAQRLAHKQKSEENFFRALEWLTGESQRRNVGIAAVKFFWTGDKRFKDLNKRFRALSIEALSNSAVYLLLESKQGTAAHELNNLKRIMDDLLLNTARIEADGIPRYEELQEAVQRAIKRQEREGKGNGLQVDKEKLKDWDNGLTQLLASSSS